MVKLRKTAKNTVLCREHEYDQIESQITNFITNKMGGILYISGVPGSGKTHTVNEAVKNITSKTNVVVSYTNCTVLNSKTQIYKEILKNYPESCCINTHKSGLQELRRHTVVDSCMHIAVVDEVDFLLNKNERVVYNLFELPYLSTNMLLILLSNRLGRLSSKVESRIGKNRIEFKAYTADQLERILNQSKNSEKENSTNLVNKFVAKKVAGGTGDIRKARDLLEDGAPDIQGMNKKIKEYYEPLIVRYHRLLNKYQKMVIRVINMSESNKMDGVGLYNDVKRECKINSIEILPYYDYCDVIEDLRDMGFIKIRNREVTRDYLVEELE